MPIDVYIFFLSKAIKVFADVFRTLAVLQWSGYYLLSHKIYETQGPFICLIGRNVWLDGVLAYRFIPDYQQLR